jgi:hypothetical protein
MQSEQGFKLFRVRKDGTIGSLFINKKEVYDVGKWMEAKSYPTKGYTLRPFWHICSTPEAPHLSVKGRAWYRVEFSDFEVMKRPKNQGGIWYLAKHIKIIGKVIDSPVQP